VNKCILGFTILLISISWQELSATDDPNEGVLFEENKNQWPEKVLFQARVANAHIYLEENTLTYLLSSPEGLQSFHE